MKKFTTWFIILLLFINIIPIFTFIPTVRAASTWYVSPGGSDTNSGTTYGTPFKTIQRAIDLSGTSDTIYLEQGTYDVPTAQGWNLVKSGTSSAWFTLSGYPGETAILNGAGVSLAPGYSLLNIGYSATVSYVRVSNLVIENVVESNTGNYALSLEEWGGSGVCNSFIRADNVTINDCTGGAILVRNERSATALPNNITIENCTISNCGYQSGYMGEEITDTGSNYNVIKDNKIINCQKSNMGICEAKNLKIFRNTIFQNQTSEYYNAGIYLDGGESSTGNRNRNIDIYNNKYIGHFVGIEIGGEQGAAANYNINIYNNLITFNYYGTVGNGEECLLFSNVDSSTTWNNIVIKHNTFCYNNNGGSGYAPLYIEPASSKMSNIYFANNIFESTGSNANYEIYSSSTNPTDSCYHFSNNLYNHPTKAVSTHWSGGDKNPKTTYEPSAVEASPQFVNLNAMNYHLTSASPAIDAGNPTYAVPFDYDGNFRPQGSGYDIGAYEYTVTTPFPIISTPSPSNGSTTGLQPVCSIIAYDPGGHSMTIQWYDNHTGSMVLRGTNTSIGNGAYKSTYTGATVDGHTYYWKMVVNDGTYTTTAVYHFTAMSTNYPPTISAPSPSNGSTVGLQPVCSIVVYDPGGHSMTIQWYDNHTGSMVLRGTNTSVGNGAYESTYTGATVDGRTYYWKMVVNDGTYTTTAVYHFTTTSGASPPGLYVSTTGSDTTGNGTIGNPWRTLQKAINMSGTSSTIYLRQGNYNDVYPATQGWKLTHSGTASAWFTLSGYPGERAVLNGAGYSLANGCSLLNIGLNATVNYVRVTNLVIENVTGSYNSNYAISPEQYTRSGVCNSYIRVDNVTIDNCREGAVRIYNERLTTTLPNNITIENCTISNCGYQSGYMGAIITDRGSTNTVIKDNKIIDCEKSNIDIAEAKNLKIFRNTILQNTTSEYYNAGIYLDGGENGGLQNRNISIYNNKYIGHYVGIKIGGENNQARDNNISIYNNIITFNYYTSVDNGEECLLFQDGASDLIFDNITVKYNTFCYNNNGGSVSIGNAPVNIEPPTTKLKNIYFVNNIFQSNGPYANYEIYSTSANPTDSCFHFSNNLYNQTTKAASTCWNGVIKDPKTTYEPSAVKASPQFVNRKAMNYHLNSTSPAIDAATSLYTVSTDYDGHPRPQHGLYDIGAYEYTTIPPIFSEMTPSNGSVNIPISTSRISLVIKDPEGKAFNYTIQTHPNVGSVSVKNVANGTKSCTISGLQYATTYRWYVNATDGYSWTRQLYTFKTASSPITKTFLVGLITDHNDSNRSIISFKAKLLLSIRFNPLRINIFSSNEKIIVSKDYKGYIGKKFIIGVFDATVL